MKAHQIGCLTRLGLLSILAYHSLAQSFDLSNDFSASSNPNGAWQYILGGSPIATQFPGLEGWSPNSVFDGSVIKFNDGTVAVHSYSTIYGGDTQFSGIRWTSPINGLITITGKAFDLGHTEFPQPRDSDWRLTIGGDLIAQHQSIAGVFASDPAALFSSNLLPSKSLSSIPVTAGMAVELLTQHSGGPYGYFTAFEMTITLVPEPSDYTLFAGACLLGFAAWSGRNARSTRSDALKTDVTCE